MNRTGPGKASPPNLLGHLFTWLLHEPVLCWLAALCALVALFYLEENWRGRRAWQQCKRALEAKGAVLDWSAHIPPAVPGDQNFFGAPNMTQWFVGKGPNSLTQRLNLGGLYQFTKSGSPVLAELRVVPVGPPISPAQSDLILKFAAPVLTCVAGTGNNLGDSAVPSPAIPLVVMEDVPLADAIKNLARQAGLDCELDPAVGFGASVARGKPVPQPTVSARWQNVTALQALVALLNNYNLQLLDNPKTAIGRIIVKRGGGPSVYVEPGVRERLGKLVQTGRVSPSSGPESRSLKGAQGFILLAHSRNPGQPPEIIVQADRMPSKEEIAEFFTAVPDLVPQLARVQVDSTSTNLFRVSLNPAPYVSAADYLAWSDSFEDEFSQIRQALQRPYAQMPGDYRDPVSMPIPNYVGVRMLVQTLAQRAQCYLLLDQPEPALKELTLIHDLCGLLESKPTGKPITLVAAMIHVAVSGLYVSVVADGLRLQAWREPELAAIQQQLEQVDLPPFVVEACREERAASCRILETASAAQFASLFASGPAATSLWAKLKDPTYLFLTFAPRGWVYQNMCFVASVQEEVAAGFNRPRQVLAPHDVERSGRQSEYRLEQFSPSTFLARATVPNYIRAWQTLALNQTLANEARLACALERWRIAEGHYPETLDRLVPRFATQIPHDLINGQPLHYRPTADGRFLLYSVGWNEKDDGGVAGDRDKGDWVWQGPAG